MKRLLALALIALVVTPLFASDKTRYLIAVRPAPARAHLLRDAEEVRAHRVREFAWVDAFAADLSAEEAAELKRSPDVRYLHPLVERHALEVGLIPQPQGSAFAVSQIVPYGVNMVRVRDVWPASKGRGPIHVAILDTGIDTRHPDLAPNFAGGYNTFTKTNDPTDDAGHGTHVSGTIAAADNQIGVVGVAPEAQIWSVKVLDKTGTGTDENLIDGMNWVLGKKHAIGGDWIVNLSLGSKQLSPTEQDAMQRMIDQGVVVVAAAGNDGFNEVEYPAAYPGVIAVGAIDSTSTIAAFSNTGSKLAVVAPGVQVLSTTRVGSVTAAGVTFDDGEAIVAAPITGSLRGEITGGYVACGIGQPSDFPLAARGKIALIKRGDLTFNAKVRNAKAAGAIGSVIYNNDTSDIRTWTLIRPDCDQIADCDDPTFAWPVALAVSAADGQRLLQNATHTINAGLWTDDYTMLSGTSMATPHVAGIVALIWSLAPDATAERVREAITSSAQDLGTPGFDSTYGFGLIDALAAGRALAPWRFGRDGTALPPGPSTRNRPVHP
jgi:serine protease